MTYPIKTLDLPAGGTVYAAPTLKMIHDFVVLCQGTLDQKEDVTGKTTVSYLKRAKRVAELILSNKPGSVGLHPAVYFYSWTGKQQPILFLTMAELLINYERDKKLNHFTRMRQVLEQFIITNRTLLNQIVRKFGTKGSGKTHLIKFYNRVFKSIEEGQTSEQIVATVCSDGEFSYLQPSENPYDGVSPTRYSTQVKSSVVIKGLLETCVKCKICHGLVPRQSISIDHIKRQEDGGNSSVDNLQVTHPYCNTGFKESAVAKKKFALKLGSKGAE